MLVHVKINETCSESIYLTGVVAVCNVCLTTVLCTVFRGHKCSHSSSAGSLNGHEIYVCTVYTLDSTWCSTF